MKKQKIKKREKSKIKSNKILFYLKEIEMTQLELAKKCKTNTAHVSRLVNGKTPVVSLAIAMKISKALKQPVEKIFTLE